MDLRLIAVQATHWRELTLALTQSIEHNSDFLCLNCLKLVHLATEQARQVIELTIKLLTGLPSEQETVQAKHRHQ